MDDKEVNSVEFEILLFWIDKEEYVDGVNELALVFSDEISLKGLFNFASTNWRFEYTMHLFTLRDGMK